MSGGIVNKNILEYDIILPPVFFETPEFPYKDRVHAIKLAEKEGYFWYCFKNHNNRIVDIGKSLIQNIQTNLPENTGNRFYLIIKRLYNIFFWNKKLLLLTKAIFNKFFFGILKVSASNEN